MSLVSSCVCARMTAACVSISIMMKIAVVSISFNINFRTGYRTVIKDAVHALLFEYTIEKNKDNSI